MSKTPATDIVERLRERRVDNPNASDFGEPFSVHDPLCREAATEIEALRSMLKEADARQCLGAWSILRRKLDEAGRLPPKATRAWAVTMANIRQGRGSTPRCEPPSESDIQWAFDRIDEVLEAAKHLPLASIRGET